MICRLQHLYKCTRYRKIYKLYTVYTTIYVLVCIYDSLHHKGTYMYICVYIYLYMLYEHAYSINLLTTWPARKPLSVSNGPIIETSPNNSLEVSQFQFKTINMSCYIVLVMVNSWATCARPCLFTPIQYLLSIGSLIAKFMGPTWGPPGPCRPQMGPMLAPWTLLSGVTYM